MSMFVYTGMTEYDEIANESILTILSMESANALTFDDITEETAMESVALEGLNLKGVWESITGMVTKLVDTITKKASDLIEKSTLLKSAIEKAGKGKTKLVGACARAGRAVKEFFSGIDMLQKVVNKFSDLLKSGKDAIISVHNKFKPATVIDKSKEGIAGLSRISNEIFNKSSNLIKEAAKTPDSEKEESESTKAAAVTKLKTVCDTVANKFKGFCNVIITKAKTLKNVVAELGSNLKGKLEVGLSKISEWVSSCISFLGGCFFKAKELAVKTLQTIRSKTAKE